MSDCGCNNNSSVTKNCGCGNTTPNPVSPTGDYLLVKAAPNHIAECASDQVDVNANRNCCAKFDLTSADTAIPASGLTAELIVPNGLDYAIGQWVYFPAQDIRLKITLINGNKLSLRNGCDDGTDGLGNPPVGTTIPRSSVFYVIDEPECQTANASQEFLDSLTQGAEDILLPDLMESDGSEKVQLTGIVIADDDESTFRKALKRAMGIFFKGGRMFLSGQIPQMVESQIGNYHELVMDKDTFEVKKRRTYGEQGVTGNKALTHRVAGGQDRYDDVRAMHYLATPILIYKSASHVTGSRDDITTSVGIDVNIPTNTTEVNSLNIYQADYIAHVHGTLTWGAGDAFIFSVKLNGVTIYEVSEKDRSGGTTWGTQISSFVKVLKADSKIHLEVKATSGSGAVYLNLNVDSILY